MPRPVRVSEAQGQLLETALDWYRLAYRLHRYREGLRVPFEIEDHLGGGRRIAAEPPTLELVVSDEIGAAIAELLAIADRLQQGSRATEVRIRRRWRAEQKRLMR